MRRGLPLGIAASAASFAAALACGACGSSSAGPGGPGDVPDAEADADAAQTLPDGANPDVDAGGSDAADAKKDVVPVGDRYCAKLVPQPKFCDDFDDGDLTNNWDVVTVLPPSMIGLDEATSTSAPASFAVQTANLTASGTSGNAAMRKTIFGTVDHAKLSFSALFPAVTFTKGIISIATLDVSTSHYFTLNLRDQNAASPAASLEEFVGGTMTRHLLTKLPPVGVWTRVTIDLDFTTGKADVTFGADKALDQEPIAAMPGTETTIRLGAVYLEGPADPFTAHFDDVVVEF